MAAPLQHRVLEALEGATNYNAWVAALTRPYLGDDPIEIGSGTGTFAALWLGAGLPRMTATEIDSELVSRLHRRFDSDLRVSVERLDLLNVTSRAHSAVVALNVLEHIADDVGALRAAARLVRPGGAIVLFVPAFDVAMSRFDRAIGHRRRYTTASLRRALQDAGVGVEVARYVNAPGLAAWIIGMRLLGMAPRDGVVLRAWDRVVVPAARRVESRRQPPFGQSVLAVGRTPA